MPAVDVRIDPTECVELVRRLRWFMANLLRETAATEDSAVVAERLREIADAFEQNEALT